MKIALFSTLFLFLALNLSAQKSHENLLKANTLFKREYQSSKGKKLILQIKHSLSNSLKIEDKSTYLFLELDKEYIIKLNPIHKEKIKNFLRSSILKRGHVSQQHVLNLDRNFKLSLINLEQEYYYLLKVKNHKVSLPFGEGLNLLRKLIE